jgi:hypothetical protein
MKDRYLKAVLTVIALELAWLGVKDIATPVSAQVNNAPTPVIIRGIQIDNPNVRLPVTVRGIQIDNPNARLQNAIPFYQMEPMLVTATAQQPVSIVAVRPIPITGAVPLKIEVDRPLPVENVGYKPGLKPGE